MTLSMGRAQREAFLADVHVGVLAVEEPGHAPLAVPIWYAYEPGGELWIVTEAGSRKGRLLRAAGRFRLCAQSEAPPYRYVSVEGRIRGIAPADVERHVRPLARRYLGPELGDRYVEATRGGDGEAIVVRMSPEHWLTVDYSRQFDAAR